MPAMTKKATFSLHRDVLEAMDQAVAEGAAPSKNALVERAIAKELRDWRRQVRRAQWEQGARDPLLLKDVEDIEAAFRSADAGTARGIR